MDLVVACYASVARHIVAANRAEASVDVFGHSWSPELGTALDALFQPKAAAHEKDEVLRNRQLCTQVSKMLRNYTSSPGYGAPFIHYAAVGRGANSCERTANHLLGMQRAIGLKAKYEAAHRFTYDVVLVSRWDVLWNRPLLLSRLDLSRHGFTVPTFCTHARGVDHKSDVERSLTAFRRRVPAACGGEATQGQVPTAATSCHPSHRPCAGDLSARARELYLLDWWFASDSAAADGFGQVASADMFANYTLLNQKELNGERNGRPTIMGHAYWGLHMVWGLRSPLRFDGMVGHDFSLGRAYHRVGCRALRPNCKGASCTAEDVVPRPWHAAVARATAATEARIGGASPPTSGSDGGSPNGLPPMPARAPLSFAYGGAETRNGCGEGYFTCEKRSRMCKEEEETWEPMDRDVSRKAWIACTAAICSRAGADRYSPRCAGAVLAAWTTVWRHSPAVNANISASLRDAGYFEGTALGWTDPVHATAALEQLTSQAAALYRVGPPPAESLSSVLGTCTNPLAALAKGGGKGKGAGLVTRL